jgi:hypothetical protein
MGPKSPDLVRILAVEKDPSLVRKASALFSSSPGIVCLECDVVDGESVEAVLSNFTSRYDADCFDLVTCFSVLMWIHLNHDDEGLERAVKLLCGRAENLIVEVQPWKSYQT